MTNEPNFPRVGGALIAALLGALLAAGCGDTKPGASSPEAPGAHDHDHALGPHGGSIHPLGAGEGHLEVVAAEEDEGLVVYLLDEAMSPLQADEPPVLNLAAGGGGARLVASAVEGEPGAWRFEGAALGDHDAHGRFRLVVGGKTYTPDFEREHEHGHEGEHGHEDDHDEHGHDHEHDHENEDDHDDHDHDHDHGHDHDE